MEEDIKMKFDKKIMSTIIFAVLLSLPIVFGARIPFNNESNWGSIIEQYLNESHTINGTLKKGINASFEFLNITGTLIIFGSLNATEINATKITTTQFNSTGININNTFQGDVKIIGTLYG